MARLAVNAAGASRGVVVLGSTGSVGRSTLEVLAALPERFHVVGLAASQNADALQLQIDQHKPRYASLTGASAAGLRGVRVLDGPTALSRRPRDAARGGDCGGCDVRPRRNRAHHLRPAGRQDRGVGEQRDHRLGRRTRHAAGALGRGVLRPVDSEHSALWQCLGFEDADMSRVERLLLTASGGPFRGGGGESEGGASR